jgi:hypothetical protein
MDSSDHTFSASHLRLATVASMHRCAQFDPHQSGGPDSTATAARSCWQQGRKFAAVFWRLPRFDRTFTGLERRLKLHQ